MKNTKVTEIKIVVTAERKNKDCVASIHTGKINKETAVKILEKCIERLKYEEKGECENEP